MYLSVQGEIIEETAFHISPFCDAVMYGAGIFETLKFEADAFYFVEEHLLRLRKSALDLGMDLPYTDEQIIGYLHCLIEKQQIRSGVAKINLMCECKGTILIITTRENHYTQEQYRSGFRLKVSDFRRNENSKLVGIKSDNYFENILEFRQAKQEGWDEVLFLNTKDRLTECSMSNIFFFRRGILYTPSEECGILNGIVRSKVLNLSKEIGIKVRTGEYAMNDLIDADEVFLTNSVMEIMPVVQIDKKIFRPVTGAFTAELRDSFDTLLEM